jgi:uncharacterized protein (TIGR03435 family)
MTRLEAAPLVTMAELAAVLPVHDRPVIDMTNLKGYYQFSWERRARSPR